MNALSQGPVLGKAVSEGLDVLTMPQDTMASRTGSEHAVALGCARCAIARSPDEAAEYAAALAKTAAKAKAKNKQKMFTGFNAVPPPKEKSKMERRTTFGLNGMKMVKFNMKEIT